MIAYEPVWAVGTGKVAEPAYVQDVHQKIRKWLSEEINESIGEKTRILYGGSVNDENCKNLIKKEDVDGFLIGGASLSEKFKNIAEIVN